MKLVKRTVIPKPKYVYNLHIRNNHNYIANDIIVSNCHTAKSKSLSNIMMKMHNAEYRYGMTGTIGSDSTVYKLQLEGLFGPVYKTITTKELIDNGTLAKLTINALVLKHSKQTKMKYQEEMKFLEEHNRRNEFIVKLALDRNGNSLILFRTLEHGKALYELAKAKDATRQIFYVSGEVDAQVREDIRRIVEKSPNAIIFASFGVFSTGINIKRLHNIIFASPSKSQIRVLQSIGRGLRKSPDGQNTILYDIIDDMGFENYALKHGMERMKIYMSERFKFKTYEIRFDGKRQ